MVRCTFVHGEIKHLSDRMATGGIRGDDAPTNKGIRSYSNFDIAPGRNQTSAFRQSGQGLSGYLYIEAHLPGVMFPF